MHMSNRGSSHLGFHLRFRLIWFWDSLCFILAIEGARILSLLIRNYIAVF